MGRRSLGRQSAGKPIPAAFLNGIAEAYEQLSAMGVSGGLHIAIQNGVPVISLSDPQPFLAKITGGGTNGIYSWIEQYAASSPGSFANGFLVGTTSKAYAVEQNGNSNVPIGTRVTLFPIGGGNYRFQVGACVANNAPAVPEQVLNFDAGGGGASGSGSTSAMLTAALITSIAAQPPTPALGLPPVPVGVF